MRVIIYILLICQYCLIACAQNNSKSTIKNQPSTSDLSVGGTCEGCEGIFESPVPFNSLNAIDTLPDFYEPGPKIEISGTIYLSDGKTPASEIIMYLYHTDQAGLYSNGSNYSVWSKRHGYIRGWIKTDKNGYYKFYTLIPASYPNSNIPKHIHPTIKEPGKTAYWIDDFVFENDPLLTEKEKNKKKPVGGNGVLVLIEKDGFLKASRDIILGLNVENYH